MPDPFAPGPPGLVTLPSAHDVSETARRLEDLAVQRAMEVFVRIDHAAGARRFGMPLRPTLLLVFGNPQVGTPLMQSQQTSGIDLPLRALIWEDEAGRTWLSYNQPDYVAQRHQIHNCEATVQAMRARLEALARAATAP